LSTYLAQQWLSKDLYWEPTLVCLPELGKPNWTCGNAQSRKADGPKRIPGMQLESRLPMRVDIAQDESRTALRPVLIDDAGFILFSLFENIYPLSPVFASSKYVFRWMEYFILLDISVRRLFAPQKRKGGVISRENIYPCSDACEETQCSLWSSLRYRTIIYNTLFTSRSYSDRWPDSSWPSIIRVCGSCRPAPRASHICFMIVT
jgi:hypothetical protein